MNKKDEIAEALILTEFRSSRLEERILDMLPKNSKEALHVDEIVEKLLSHAPFNLIPTKNFSKAKFSHKIIAMIENMNDDGKIFTDFASTNSRSKLLVARKILVKKTIRKPSRRIQWS